MNQTIPQDDQAAITISSLNSDNYLSKEMKLSQDTSFAIKKVNTLLEKVLINPTQMLSDCFLSLLKEYFCVDYARLKYQQKTEEWTILSEYSDIKLSEDEIEDAHRLTCEVPSGREYCLEIHFSANVKTVLQKEYCRLILLIFSFYHQYQSKKGFYSSKQPETIKTIDSAWNDLVGQQLKSHLNKYTDLCRHSETVLVTGQTGTGKELVAKSLHSIWNRSGNFVAINCAAIPADLLESELFGVTKGAATGVNSREGYFAKAHQGTLFLDEISEMSISLQSKLLRVIQEREYFSVGSDSAQKADVKIVGATNQSPVLLLSGKMRADLYFRLSQTVVTLPPLKERVNDIASLCQFFLERLERKLGRGVLGLSQSALQKLKQYEWPGNVRELQHILQYLYINTPEGSLIQSIHLPDTFQKLEDIPETGTLASIVRSIEKKVISRELERLKNVGHVSKILGLSEGYLYRKIKQLGIKWRT
jgi:arginine utilization regulatory protein